MLAACEAGDVFGLLEGGAGGARDAADALLALYGAVRDPWLTHALLLYHARTGSARAVELLARAPDPHARHLLDALRDQLRAADPHARHHALAALAPIVARRPPWLHRLLAHPLTRDLLRCARAERDPLPLVHALLALATLLPAAPALAAAHPAELADALMRPALLDPPPAASLRAHLHLAQLALFRALYATHPCTLVEALRAHGAEAGVGATRDAWERAVAALADSVRLHPALVMGSRTREADSARWSRLEIHDVVAEGRRLSLTTREEAQPSPAPVAAPAATPAQRRRSPAPGSGAHAARAAAALRPGAEPWFPLSERCALDSAPAPPLPAEADAAAEPPEAAVEATPENTPAREPRAQFRFPAESGAVRAIGRRSPPPASAPGDAYAARLQRLAVDRNAAESPVAFGGTPPPVGAPVARPEPSRPAPAPEPEPLNVEDREVTELTRRALADTEWAEPEGHGGWRERALARDPRRGESGRRDARARARRAAPALRSASCAPSASGARTRCAAAQTVDAWPEPYEFIIADYFRALPDEAPLQSGEVALPCERLDAYLVELYAGKAQKVGGGGCGEQLALVHAQLMYERWRREAHAERNRRLLGRCRQVRALELRGAALEERLRAARRERDDLRARLEREAPAPQPDAAAAERGARLEAALAAERAGRLRAGAGLHEADAPRAVDAAELQRTRGESFEAARHVEALARAALAAERRADHVRRLRRELVVLAEREARLEEAARSGMRAAAAAGSAAADAGVERALRAACARAEAEAEASGARAEAAAARAHELEAQVAARDETIARLKRATRMAADEGAARLRALHDKYAALMRVVRAGEARRLEWLARAPPAAATAAPALAPAPGDEHSPVKS
ncbi:hypothetical protein K1T71_011588 [Dendrolimus kikuchii]|uniref:Uncharacterized protein n=1 Tax=Dendrolimus kikuchii TaxID=765133 RepID=A0ACC1CLY6_9NEOP|nr:hypothetical protein K1T71_011588 [Dendrolimus kikuchii]